MSKIKRAIEDIQRIGWELNNKSLVKLVILRQSQTLKKREKCQIKK